MTFRLNLLLPLLLLSSCSSEHARTETERLMLLGKVQELHEHQFLANQSEEAGEPTISKSYIFNEKGNIVEYVMKNHRENRTSTITYTFDEQGRRMKGTSTHRLPLMIFHKNFEYPEDLHGFIIRNFNSDSMETGFQEFTYDDDGFVNSEVARDPDGEMRHRIESNWHKGKILSKKIFDRDTTLQTSMNYEYDDNFLVKKITTEHVENRSRTEIFKYEADKTGNWVKQIILTDAKPAIITFREIVYR